jgi:putative membrane protein
VSTGLCSVVHTVIPARIGRFTPNGGCAPPPSRVCSQGGRVHRLMTAPTAPNPDPSDADVSRRTWLAAERTWLAWWRTGLGAAALAIGVGRIVPGLTGGARWPYRLLGLGYGLLAVAVLVLGAGRQQRAAKALRRGGFEPLSSPLVVGLTAVAVALSTATIGLLVAGL